MMERTTARLRRTFEYPTDDDEEEDLPEALDEEEQESLIQSLILENTARNAEYAKIFLPLPLVCMFPYLGSLFTAQLTFLSILSITSLLSTAYLMRTLPYEQTGIAFLDALNNSKPNQDRDRDNREGGSSSARYVPIQGITAPETHGPVRTYLPYLNVILSTTLALLGLVFRGREMVWWGFSWLPGAVYVVILSVKFFMGSVNPEAELGALRYEFKGA